MSLGDELVRLAELRDRGDLSQEEFARAKERLLAVPELAAPGTDGALLLYRVVTTWQRRAVWVLAVVAVLFGLVALWSFDRYLMLNEQANAVEDQALVERFGIRIPDPRPAIERAELRARASTFGGLAVVTGLVAVGAVLGTLLVRPPRSPKHKPPPGAADKIL